MFEFLFKYPANAFERGKIVLAGGWPLWLLIALMAAAAAAIAWLIYRRNRASLVEGPRRAVIWALQTALACLLLLLLWQPALSVSALKAQQNVVAVIVDDSKSMGLSEDGTPRRQKAIDALNGGLLDRKSVV